VIRRINPWKLSILALAVAVILLSLAACGEKPCNREGATKADNGVLYHCADRHNGNGLRWYKS
jgi:hypothetical protein